MAELLTLSGTPQIGDLEDGQILQGAYQITQRLAQGGMGTVYRATQLSLGRSVAIKTINTNQPNVTQRFIREAKLLSQLTHPNVVSLIEFGTTEAGLPFMAMESLEGCTLDQLVPREEGLPLDQLLHLMGQICAGVGAAHRLQMVHRDLKPTNIFLARLPDNGAIVKILDFGIAKALEDREAGLTQNGTLLGSCGYMSPEQIHGAADVDARTDIYSLGGLLYFMLAGQPAYRGKSTAEILSKQLTRPPEPLDLHVSSRPIPPGVMPVILKAMHTDLSERYQTTNDLMFALREAVGCPSTAARLTLPRSASHGPSEPTVLASHTIEGTVIPTKERLGQAVPLPRRWRKPAFLGAGVAALVALAVVAAWGWQSYSSSSAAPKPSALANSPARRGVTATEIRLGMSAPFSGPAVELGRGMERGLATYFRHFNDQGGIAGRKVKLIALDDGYEPARALANMRELVSDHDVFAVIGNVGTPTAEVTVPFALEKELLFFGPYTGANLLRKNPPDRFVFNFRASYAEETAAIVRYLIEVKRLKPEQIAVFAQQDGYGEAGFQGVAKELRKHGRGMGEIVRVGYARNSADVEGAVRELGRHPEVKAVVMVPIYRAAARFVQKMRDAKYTGLFTSVSFVGSDALAEEFRNLGGDYGTGVIVTQVVPPIDSRSTAVGKYREHLRKYYPSEQPSFVSLEGYLTAALFTEGLRRAGADLTTERTIDGLESIQKFDLGLGASIDLGPSEHQGLHKVWGTVLDKSLKFQALDLD